jgi:hydroxyethylthiazole kinase-like uncharacterized protein yjeF
MEAFTHTVVVDAAAPVGNRWPLHNAAATRQAETLALARHAPHTLMARAGLAVARWASAWAPHARHITVWAGPGNNGGDGLVAARHLHMAGRQVTVLLFANPEQLPADAAWALAQARQAGVSITQGSQSAIENLCRETDLVVDALLGIGIKRPPRGDIARAIAVLSDPPIPVLSVDLPSGLNPDTGMPLGEHAVVAAATLALLTLKPGCFTAQGRDHAGAMWFDGLGHDPGPGSAWLGGKPVPVTRPHASHKGRQGDVAVVGGDAGMEGALWLAAQAALAAGAGRVFASPLSKLGAASSALPTPEIMLRSHWWQAAPAVLQSTTVVAGCGGGGSVVEAMPALLHHACRLVLDADALNALSADPMLLQLLQRRAQRGAATIISPHPLEAARLLSCTVTEVQHDRLAAAQSLSQLLGVTAVLKGSGTVIAEAGVLPIVNPTGNGTLATPGSGDVLAGWIGGTWAQQPRASPANVAAAAVWQHGHAADLHAQRWPGAPILATALIQAMHKLPPTVR